VNADPTDTDPKDATATDTAPAPDGPQDPAARPPRTLSLRTLNPRKIKPEHVRDYGIVVVVVIVFVYFSFTAPSFLTGQNLLNILFQNATIAIPALALTLVIIAGNFDLSIGGIFTLSGVLCAWTALHVGLW
jgi:ABC-type xylose transport system permease subunit